MNAIGGRLSMTTDVKNIEGANPLGNYLRSPKLFIVLPSQGNFSHVDTQSQITGEIPVFPLTAKDETMLRNPDALLNGESLVSVIQSVTGIKDVYELASPDVDVILMAARYATYGHELELNSKCPQCEHEHELTINIENVLETVEMMKSEYVLELDNGLSVYLKPYTYRDAQRAALQAFKETNELNKLSAAADQDDIQKLLSFNKSFQAMADLNISILANSIIKVIIPQEGDVDDIVVEDRDYIKDWVMGIGKVDADVILDEANRVNNHGIKREVDAKCPECGHEYDQRLEYNPASFFDLGS